MSRILALPQWLFCKSSSAGKFLETSHRMIFWPLGSILWWDHTQIRSCHNPLRPFQLILEELQESAHRSPCQSLFFKESRHVALIDFFELGEVLNLELNFWSFFPNDAAHLFTSNFLADHVWRHERIFYPVVRAAFDCTLLIKVCRGSMRLHFEIRAVDLRPNDFWWRALLAHVPHQALSSALDRSLLVKLGWDLYSPMRHLICIRTVELRPNCLWCEVCLAHLDFEIATRLYLNSPFKRLLSKAGICENALLLGETLDFDRYFLLTWILNASTNGLLDRYTWI